MKKNKVWIRGLALSLAVLMVVGTFSSAKVYAHEELDTQEQESIQEDVDMIVPEEGEVEESNTPALEDNEDGSLDTGSNNNQEVIPNEDSNIDIDNENTPVIDDESDSNIDIKDISFVRMSDKVFYASGAKTYSIAVTSIMRDTGKPSGMYMFENAIVTRLENGTYVVRMHQSSKNRNVIALTDDKEAAKNHEVAWYIGGGDDGYWFTLPVQSLDNPLYAVMSSESRIADGNDFSNVICITFDKSSMTNTEEKDASLNESNLNPSEGSKYNVTNNTAMFKVIDIIYSDNVLYVTLNGTGVKYMYKGTYEQALATGTDSSRWIPYHVRNDEKTLTYIDADGGSKSVLSEGKYMFAIPISPGESYVQLQAYSDSYKLWYSRCVNINRATKTATAGDHTENISLSVTNNSTSPRLNVSSSNMDVIGGPYNIGYAITANVNVAGYNAAYFGTAQKASTAANSSLVFPTGNKYSFVVEKINGSGATATITSYLDKEVPISFRSASDNKWYEYILTFSKTKKSMVIKANEIAKPPVEQSKDIEEDEPSEEEKLNNGVTSAINNTIKLPDGKYTLDRFTFSGGTGRVNITASSVTIKGGKSYIDLTFSSTTWTYVKAAGGKYFGSVVGGSKVFNIPVVLNANNTIIAQTVAMSQPHEVTYQIFPYLAAAENASVKDSESLVSMKKDELDEEAPEIIGLKYDTEVKLEYAQGYKLFKYEGGIAVLEIDLTLGKDIAKGDSKTKEKDTEKVLTGDDGEEIKPGFDEYQAELYKNKVLKYMIIPEDEEVPVGLEKEFIIIKLPLENGYLAANNAISALKNLGLEDKIGLLGVEDKELEADFVGGADDIDYKEIVKKNSNFAVLDNSIIPNEEDEDRELTLEEQNELYEEVTSKLALLGVPIIFDISDQEEDEKASLEWIKIFGTLFDMEDEAEDIYNSLIKDIK